jgi:hypothetical protein
MYSGIRFLLLHHLWEKGPNECSGETRFEAMAFLPRIAAALRIAPLPKALGRPPVYRRSLQARVTVTGCRWFSVKEAAVGWFGDGNACKDSRCHPVD